MTINRTRTALAGVALGAIALTGAFATGVAGAQGVGGSSGSGGAAKRFVSTLSSEQRTCLKDSGVVRPGHDATFAERQSFLTTFETAAGTCGITLPAKLERKIDWITSMDQTQFDCLKANVTRPTDQTPEARAQFHTQLRAAVQTCGITRPAA